MSEKNDEIKKLKTFSVKFNRYELVHLRDLFNVALPPDLKMTVSQALAAVQARPLIETKLWQKICAACVDAEVPMDDDAPDFVVTAVTSPALNVFPLAHDPDQEDNSGPFEDDDSEDEEDKGTDE